MHLERNVITRVTSEKHSATRCSVFIKHSKPGDKMIWIPWIVISLRSLFAQNGEEQKKVPWVISTNTQGIRGRPKRTKCYLFSSISFYLTKLELLDWFCYWVSSGLTAIVIFLCVLTPVISKKIIVRICCYWKCWKCKLQNDVLLVIIIRWKFDTNPLFLYIFYMFIDHDLKTVLATYGGFCRGVSR